jgi:NADPH:quinone reductase-like Zn-dependent oxidoreductase
LVSSGQVKPHVSQTYPLEQASQALKALEHQHPIGKVVLSIQ